MARIKGRRGERARVVSAATATLATIVFTFSAGAALAETVYTKTNLHIHRNKISAINYQSGSLLPLGTKVHIEKRGRKYYELKAGSLRFRFYNHRATGMSMRDAFDLHFGADPKPRLAELSKRERRLVRRAKVEKGMSKEAVLLSLGYPPPHRTPSTRSPEWTYWRSKMATFRVLFDGEDRVERVDDGEEKKEGGGFLSGLFGGGDDEEEKDIRYAMANIHTHKGIVSWVNYLTGPVIPFGTKIEVTDIDDDSVEFLVVKTKKEFEFQNDEDRSGHKAIDLFERFFSKEDPKRRLSRLDRRDRRRVRGAKPRIGMSKEAVLMAIGPPPPHKTSSTDADEWTYWKNRFRKMHIMFDGEGKVEVIR